MRYSDAMDVIEGYVNSSDFYLVNPKYFRNGNSSMLEFRTYIKSFLYKGVSFHISTSRATNFDASLHNETSFIISYQNEESLLMTITSVDKLIEFLKNLQNNTYEIDIDTFGSMDFEFDEFE